MPRYAGLYVSISQVKMYLRCPRQFQLRYVLGERPAFVPVALAFGRAFHSSLAFFYEQLKDGQSPPTFDEIVGVFAAVWDDVTSDSVPLQVDEDGPPVDQLAKARDMLRAFHLHAAAASTLQVEHVEHDFSVDLHDPDTGEVLEEKLVGALDLVVLEGQRRVVVEHKSAAKRWTDDQARFDLQSTAYKYAARLMGLGDVGLRLQVVTKTRVPAVHVENLVRDDLAEQDFLRTVLGVLRAVDAGAFYPVRGWQCNGCQYAHACVGSDHAVHQ